MIISERQELQGEEKAAERIQKTLDSFGVESHLEEFSFDTFQIKKAKLKVTEPYTKEYTVTGYGRCGNTAEDGLEAPFAYAENGDDISLAYVSGKIVMVNDPVRKDMYRKLVKAGAVGFISIAGSPLDEGVDLVPRAYALPKNLPGEEKKEAGREAVNYDNRIPGVSIHYKDAIELVTKGASQVCLSVEQEIVTRTSRNIVARIEGTDKAEEILTLTAHYDSVPEDRGRMIICPEQRSLWNCADISMHTDHAEQWNSYGLVQKRKVCWEVRIISKFMKMNFRHIVLT